MNARTGELLQIVGLGTQLRAMADLPDSGHYVHYGAPNPAVLKTPDSASGVFVTMPPEVELLIFEQLSREHPVDVAARGLAATVLPFPRHRRIISSSQQ